MIHQPAQPDPSFEACTRYGVLDFAEQPALQGICELVGAAIAVHHVAVVFVTTRRCWTPAAIGWTARTLSHAPIEAITQGFRWSATDATAPPGVCQALFRSDERWTFAAGVPLTTPDGVCIGLMIAAGDRPGSRWSPQVQARLQLGAGLAIQSLEGGAAHRQLLLERQQQAELQLRLERASLTSRTFQAIADLTTLPLDEDDGLRGAAQLTAELIRVDWSGVQMHVDGPLETVWPMNTALASQLSPLPPMGLGPVFTLNSGTWTLRDGRPAALAWIEAPGRAVRLIFVRLGDAAHWSQADRQVLRDLVWALKHVLSITAQRHALAGLEDQLQFALKNFPMVLWMTDAQGRLVAAEGSGLAPLGVQADEVLGRSLEILADAVDSPDVREQLGRDRELRRTITLADRVYDTHQALLPRGGMLGVAFDVTDLAQSRSQAQQAQLQAETVLELTQVLALADPLRTVTARALEVLLPALPDTWLVLWEHAPENHVLRPLVTRGDVPSAMSAYQARGVQDADMLARRLLAGEPVHLDPSEIPPQAKAAGMQAALLLPVLAGGSLLVLGAYRTQERAWLDAERELLAVASRVLQVSLERRETLASLHAAASTDPLTGLCNRRAFEEDLAQRLNQGPLTLVTLDVDGLKLVNDQYGHARGDDLLRTVTQAVREVLRDDDRAYRVGGDEFCLLLRGEQRHILPELQQALAALPALGFPEAGASAGVAYAPLEGTRPETLWQLADERMYVEKARRRRERFQP